MPAFGLLESILVMGLDPVGKLTNQSFYIGQQFKIDFKFSKNTVMRKQFYIYFYR
jgi:hypothetical protein